MLGFALLLPPCFHRCFSHVFPGKWLSCPSWLLGEQEQGGGWPEGWIHLALHGHPCPWNSDGEGRQEAPGDGNCSPFQGHSWAFHGCHSRAQLAPPKSSARAKTSFGRRHLRLSILLLFTPAKLLPSTPRNTREGGRKKINKNWGLLYLKLSICPKIPHRYP